MVGMDDGGCVHLDDDRRAADAVAGLELGAIININRSEATIEISAMLLDDCVSGIRPLLTELRQANFLHRTDSDRTEVNELDRLRELETVNTLVREAEAAGEIVERAIAKPLRIDVEGELVALAK